MVSTPSGCDATKHLPLPDGDDERVVGFGVMGLPFTSGHYLAYRDFPETSFSPAYKSVWHRTPAGVWTFYATPREVEVLRMVAHGATNKQIAAELVLSEKTGHRARGFARD